MSNLIENEDYVSCKFCKFISVSIKMHITRTHKMPADQYDGVFIAKKFSLKRSAIGKINGNWIQRKKDAGEDLTDYKKKMSASVSKSIMGNDAERKRRSVQWGLINKTPEARKRASDAAKKTSARPEILEARSKVLANWRKENPDEFYEKCISKMHENWHSKPEILLFEILSKLDGFCFKQNQVVKSELFTTKSRRKQCDIADKSKRIYIEFDGIYHFKDKIYGNESFLKTKERDKLFDEHVIKNEWLLIRISYDQYSYKTGFNVDALEKLFELLKSNNRGVYKIGTSYV